MGRDLRKELEAFDGTFPPAWKPERAGAILTGTVAGYSVAPNSYGGETRICTLRLEDGSRVAVWLSNVTLLQAFGRERPRVGERIGIKFLGTVETRAGRPCKRFHLIVDRPEAEPDFTPLGNEVDDTGALEEEDEAEWAAAGSPLPEWATSRRR